MDKPFLSQIQGFGTRSLKHVDTQITTTDGRRFVERRDTTGGVNREQCRATGLGFCPDFSPDKVVGTATESLLVGSQDVAHDYPRLRELGVTHILNVGINIPNAFADEFTYLTVEMLDDLNETLLTHYPKCERFIDEGRRNGVVLVHCNAGVSRSSSIALSYVMHREGIPLEKALERLRSTRPAVKPNEGFMRQLREIENSLGISTRSSPNIQ